ncbi:hypothetical protein F2P56_024421 [Juglans regia]|uniref:Protein JASON-like n=2 Tax=Juglans regia TaxID=51240 RepID=A0A833UCB1_JUGRE|nr:uncharacterized protein LOC109018822 [Juglans regia]KAF5454782.1 hypothetical protein F2P56_024421 [Juglans regia]
MGCFLACFSTPKHRNPQIMASGDQSLEANEAFQTTLLQKQKGIEKPVTPITESEVRVEVQPNRSAGKKFTFEEKQNGNRGGAEEGKQISGLIASSILPFPSNHRYQRFAGELDYDDNDEIGNDDSLIQEETSESLFSLSIDSRTHVGAIETGEKEVNSPIPVHASTHEELKTNASQCFRSVLTPIENLTQGKAVQAKTDTPLMNKAKEKVNLEPKSNDLKPKQEQILVDTSLSSWLVVSESSPSSRNSSNSTGNSASEKANSIRSHENKPVLGALTLEEHLWFSASPSSRLSKSQSPEDKLIIGTVGSYWSHTGQSRDSGSLAQALLVKK